MASPKDLLAEASSLLQNNEPQDALTPATSALEQLRKSHGQKSPLTLPALALVSEIQLELGDTMAAYQSFTTAASIDPDGSVPDEQGGGVDKFLYLAQLDESGGKASLGWFEKAVSCLDRDIAAQEAKGIDPNDLDAQLERAEKRTKLAHALCGMCELWMTDLSFEDAAEAECEALITRAMLLEPDDAQTLQTLASIRLSQEKMEEAQGALERSLELWADLPAGHPMIPEFAARIALARTLMEAGMEGDALEVCERLVGEDDQSVEAWYLGGWCQVLMAQDEGEGEDEEEGSDAKQQQQDADMTLNGAAKEGNSQNEDVEKAVVEEKKRLLLSAREWLRNCLKLCQLLEYEDERLREHAQELVGGLDEGLGDEEIEDDDDEAADHDLDDDEDTDDNNDHDEEMAES